MRGLRILIANTTMATLTGTETYVRDLAIGLLRRGHTPIVYSPELGELARELRDATVPVVDDLNAVAETPDVIHGNHNTELMTALLHFPTVPGVFCCHSWTELHSSPPSHPRILKYIAVDDTCHDRLLYKHSIPEGRLRVILNTTDLERFKPRGPLPERPRRALVFSNGAGEHSHLGAVRQACGQAGIELDVLGAASNTATARPELILGQYDLVFAKARCALESLAVGTAVILCDYRGSGPLVTTNELENLRRFNFGIRTLREKLEPEILVREIARYNAQDATEVSHRIRATAHVDGSIDELLALYHDVIAEHRCSPTADALVESRATAAYLGWLAMMERKQTAEHQEVLANSLSLRLRNRIAGFPLVEKPLKLLARIARRGQPSTKARRKSRSPN
jgi:hypothetical protein